MEYGFHVAVDANAIADRASRTRGIGRYLAQQFTALQEFKPHWKFSFCGVETEPVKEITGCFGGFDNFNYIPWEELIRVKPNLLYLPDPLGFTTYHIIEIARLSGVPTVCTFHDLIPLIFQDLYFDNNPTFKSYYFLQLEKLRNHCDLFLANSQHTAADLKNLAGIPQEKLEVILAGVNDKFSEDLSSAQIETLLWKYQLQRDNFLLFIGVPDQRKNSRGMFSGLEIARRSLNKDLKLVIAGDIPDFLIQDLRRLQQKLNVPQEAVMFTGYVTDEELTALYKSAFALLFPSLYEGFGFPIVEAMKAGLPVIAGRNSSQVEVSGDAAMLVDALNNEEIGRAIAELYSNPALRLELSEKGKIHCRQYTWEKVAAKTAQYLWQYFGNKKGVQSNA